MAQPIFYTGSSPNEKPGEFRIRQADGQQLFFRVRNLWRSRIGEVKGRLRVALPNRTAAADRINPHVVTCTLIKDYLEAD